MMRLWFAAALCIAVGTGVPAQAQDKVSFPSTDADLKGGTPTTITGYLYKPEGTGPFPAVIGMHGCNGLVDPDGKVFALYGASLRRKIAVPLAARANDLATCTLKVLDDWD
jgi:dienelactone hydrolase